MDNEDLRMQKANLGMYKDMIMGALSNKGVLFILLCFVVLVILAFTVGYGVGYAQGIEAVECVKCLNDSIFSF